MLEDSRRRHARIFTLLKRRTNVSSQITMKEDKGEQDFVTRLRECYNKRGAATWNAFPEIDDWTKNGRTALHICAERDYGDTACLLLDSHIDYTLRDAEGKTAYEVSLEPKSQPVADAIKAKQEMVQENWKRAGRRAKFCTIF